MSITKYQVISGLAKTIGIGSLVLTSKQIVERGYDNGLDKTQVDRTDRMTDVFISHQFESKTGSVKEGLKRAYRNFLLQNDSLYSFKNIINVVVETVKEAGGYIIPIALGIGAACTKIKKPNIKTGIGVACAAGLSLLGVKTLFSDILAMPPKHTLD